MSDILIVEERELKFNVNCVRGFDMVIWQFEDNDRTKLSFEASSAMTIPVILERIRERYFLLTFYSLLSCGGGGMGLSYGHKGQQCGGVLRRADSTHLTSGWL